MFVADDYSGDYAIHNIYASTSRTISLKFTYFDLSTVTKNVSNNSFQQSICCLYSNQSTCSPFSNTLKTTVTGLLDYFYCTIFLFSFNNSGYFHLNTPLLSAPLCISSIINLDLDNIVDITLENVEGNQAKTYVDFIPCGSTPPSSTNICGMIEYVQINNSSPSSGKM
jgi:hypothetical protein